MSQPKHAVEDRFRVPPDSEGNIRAASADVLSLMGLLLRMPLRIVSRFEGNFYRIVDVADELGLALRPGQIIAPRDPLVPLLAAAEYVQAPGGPPPNAAMAEFGLRSYIGIPILLSDGQMIGTLSAADVREHFFSATIRDALVLLARMLGHEIERAERERELRIIADISHAFVRQTDMEGTFHEVVARAVGLFEADYCLLHRIDLPSAVLTLVARYGAPLPVGQSRRLTAAEETEAIAEAARRQRILWVPDARNSPLIDSRFAARFGIASTLHMPLVVDGVTEGVLTVAHRDIPYLFTPALLRAAEILANEAALAMRRYQLWEAMKRRQYELSVLNDLSRLCTSRLELEPLLREIANELRRVVAGVTDCFILLLDRQGQMQPVAASGALHDVYRATRYPPAEPSIARQVIDTRAPVVVDDLENSPLLNPTMQRRFPLRAMIGVPLIARGKILGATLVGHGAHPCHWADDEVNRLQTAANQVALSIANVQLYEEVASLAVHDPLTGLYNRRYLEQKLRQEMLRSRRYGRPLSCAMMDLDFFKQVNDSYGHALGDRVLQEVTRRLRQVARSNDVLARYGGEEFTLLLPESGVAEAWRTAERLRGIIASRPFSVAPDSGGRPVEITLTASLGVCTCGPAIEEPRQLLAAADDALYQAKAAGRNRVVCVGGPPGFGDLPLPG